MTHASKTNWAQGLDRIHQKVQHDAEQLKRERPEFTEIIEEVDDILNRLDTLRKKVNNGSFEGSYRFEI